MRLHFAEEVQRGRLRRNLYQALREPIDAARETFRARFFTCPSMVDYLDLEITRALDGGGEVEDFGGLPVGERACRAVGAGERGDQLCAGFGAGAGWAVCAGGGLVAAVGAGGGAFVAGAVAGGTAVGLTAAGSACFLSSRSTCATGTIIFPSKLFVIVTRSTPKEIISPVIRSPLRRCKLTVSARHA